MNDIQHEHDMNRGSENHRDHNEHRPYWKRAHQDWRFWTAVCLMIAAMGIYVLSDNFATLFRSRPRTPTSNSVGQ
jgi:hypothetical protein